MENIKIEQLITATKGTLLGEPKDLSQTISYVDTDSRDIHPNSVFFALIGERFDAHDFMDSLSDSVADVFIISKELTHYNPEKYYIKVENTHNALGDLALFYRSLFQIPFITVTGSVGKTTAKDMIASVLASKFSVHKTEGNFNNTIGLPLTLFQLTKEHEVCILEMGMDTKGEIDYLSNIAKPDMAVITNVGVAHIERLGSREHILQAKLEVLPHVSQTGQLFLNGDDEFLLSGVKNDPLPKTTVSIMAKGTYNGTILNSNGNDKTTCNIKSPEKEYHITIPALGNHMLYPTMFALAIAEKFNLTSEEISQGIENFIPTKMRMNQIQVSKNITFLDDTYNANPQSMKAALDVLTQHTSQQKIAILGDMFELGEFSKELHLEIGTFVAENNIDTLVTIGEMARFIGEGAVNQGMKKVFICEDKEQAFSLLQDIIPESTTVLFKASRGMALETLVKQLVEHKK